MHRGEGTAAKPPSARRVLESLTSRGERLILQWLAVRVPGWVTPNWFTALGLVGALITAVSLAAASWAHNWLWLAPLGLGLNWLGDSLDGTVARARAIERPQFGFYIDHLSDLASQLLIMLGLGASSFVRFEIACLGLIGYLMLSVVTLVRLHVFRTMQLSYFGIGPTEVRIAIAAGCVVAATHSMPIVATPIGPLSMFDMGTLFVVTFALGSAAVTFAADATRLAALDPPRSAPRTGAVAIELPSPSLVAMEPVS